MPRLLVANGEDVFVTRLIRSLATKHGMRLNALVTDAGFTLDLPGVQEVTQPGDETHVLLTLPIDPGSVERAIALVDGLPADRHLLFIANELDPEHARFTDHLRGSGRPWTIVHPVAMMDFAFAALPPQVAKTGVVFGISGTSRIGFVAGSDIMRVLKSVISEPGHEQQEYHCTGPEAVDMPTVVHLLSEVLDRKIDYVDLPEREMKSLMMRFGRQDPEVIERLVMSQLRAWRDGTADVVTGAVREITGREPMSVARWFARHADRFPRRTSIAQRAAGAVVKARYRDRII